MLLETSPPPVAHPCSHHEPRRALFAAWRLLVLSTVLVLLVVAVWFRVWRLGTTPGVNGDEAWLGVQVLSWLRGEPVLWRTPTGNPINPFLFIPQVLGHALFAPSFALLRVPAVISGLLALIVNLVWCRRHFGMMVAVASTLLLAVLPINIAYSRFAWDASQSLLASLVVVYLTLETLRAPQQRIRWPLAAGAALAAAVLVHPTNIFLAPLVVVPSAYLWRAELQMLWSRRGQWQYWAPAAVALCLAAVVAYAIAGRWLHIAAGRLANPAAIPQFIGNYARLFSGTTVYQFLAGSHAGVAATGIDLAVCVGIVAAYTMLWRRALRTGHTTYLLLLSGWAGGIVAFFLVAGPEAMAPHFERYSIWLIGPGCLLLTLAIRPLLIRRDMRGAIAQLAGLSLACCLLADFQLSYFRQFDETGGQSHQAFRTGPVEPKAATLARIAAATPDRSADKPVLIIANEWWAYWPIRYLAFAYPHIAVEQRPSTQTSPAFDQSVRERRVWWVEFTDDPACARTKARLSQLGMAIEEQTVDDPLGRPILSLIRPAAADAIP